MQLFIVSNESNTYYFANNNNEHFAFDADEQFLPVYQFADKDNEKIAQLHDFSEAVLRKCALGELISKYMVLVATERKMMIMRPYQIYAVKAIMDCIEQNRGNGYIWHTTGSGKTLTSFKASTLLKDNRNIAKCLFVVDRKDLDRQTRDFAYNKSATKRFPEGYISMLREYDTAAVPNSIFTCFRITDSESYPLFFDYLFHNNYHGHWLKKYIEVGARAHGALSFDTKHLWSMPLALPDFKEQQKIADCLSSIDELIDAESRKRKALEKYKKGLMQKLFPAEGKALPEWRFPEFQGCGEWKSKAIEHACQMFSGGTPDTSKKEFYGGEIPFIRSAEINKSSTELFITEEGFKNSSAKMVKKGDVLIALYGANSGEVALSKINGAINQAILCLRHETNNEFVYHYFTHMKNWIISKYIQGGQL